MLSIKNDLLVALAAGLEQLSPGAGGKAAFESPKVAAHGDFACTAAMQLAKGLKQNPRQVAEGLKAILLASPVFERWVEAIEIAGPGFINIKLKAVAKQETVRKYCTLVRNTGSNPSAMKKPSSSLYRPTQPGRCMWAMAGRPRWAMRFASCW